MFFDDSLFDKTLSSFFCSKCFYNILFNIYSQIICKKNHFILYCEVLFSQALCLKKGFVEVIKIGRVKIRQITLSIK